MIRSILPILLAVSLSLPAMAKSPVFVVSKAVADKPTVTRDETVGYVLLRSDMASPVHLMKIPSAEDEVAYATLRAEALLKERKKYPGKVAAYKRDLATYNILKKNDKPLEEPQPPVEPTEENFVFTPFNLLAGVSVGPMNRFAKGEGGKSTYLQSLTPGTYRLYGPMSVMPNGAFGTCYCMGSVKFAVKAGEITDLGTMKGAGLAPVRKEQVDGRLKDWPIRSADYRAVGKLPNYFGLAIGRITPIAGVIDYDRDRIIDLADDPATESGSAGTPVPSGNP